MNSKINELENKKLFSSWSGGKDSCLALYRAIRSGGIPTRLLTMFTTNGERSRSHGLSREVILAQSDALAIPLIVRNASWDSYEDVFTQTLVELQGAGIEYGVFGDIDLEPHREWVEKVCATAGITPLLPLWQTARRQLLTELLAAGFKAIIVAIKDSLLDRSFLGRQLDHELLAELENIGIDACGEKGEYHSLVVDGPIFKHQLAIRTGAIVNHDGYSFLDIQLAD